MRSLVGLLRPRKQGPRRNRRRARLAQRDHDGRGRRSAPAGMRIMIEKGAHKCEIAHAHHLAITEGKTCESSQTRSHLSAERPPEGLTTPPETNDQACRWRHESLKAAEGFRTTVLRLNDGKDLAGPVAPQCSPNRPAAMNRPDIPTCPRSTSKPPARTRQIANMNAVSHASRTAAGAPYTRTAPPVAPKTLDPRAKTRQPPKT